MKKELKLNDIKKVINGFDEKTKFLCEVEESKYELLRNLAKCRQDKGLSQKDIAKIIGINQQAISRIENDENEPLVTNLIKYLKALDLDINDLFKK